MRLCCEPGLEVLWECLALEAKGYACAVQRYCASARGGATVPELSCRLPSQRLVLLRAMYGEELFVSAELPVELAEEQELTVEAALQDGKLVKMSFKPLGFSGA